MIFIFPYILHVMMCECVCDHSCMTLADPMDCRLPGSSVHGIFQARILGRVAISYFRRFSWVVKQEKLYDYGHSIKYWFIRAQTEVLIVHILFPIPWYFSTKDTCKIHIWSHVFYYQYQFSHSVMSDSLWHHGLQHARPPCPLPTPRAYSNSHTSLWWCHPTISFSVILFSCLQSFPTSGSFLVSLFFTSGGQSIEVSASASVLPMNIQNWFPLRWAGWISLQSKGLSRVFSNTTVQKHQFFGTQLSLWSNSHTIHDYWKNHSFD